MKKQLLNALEQNNENSILYKFRLVESYRSDCRSQKRSVRQVFVKMQSPDAQVQKLSCKRIVSSTVSKSPPER